MGFIDNWQQAISTFPELLADNSKEFEDDLPLVKDSSLRSIPNYHSGHWDEILKDYLDSIKHQISKLESFEAAPNDADYVRSVGQELKALHLEQVRINQALKLRALANNI